MKYTAGEGTIRKDKVEDGEYRLAVTDAEETTSSNGNPMCKLKLETLGPVGGEDFEESTGPVVYDNLVFTPAAFWKIDQFRTAIGEKVEKGEEVEIDPDDLIGATLSAHLTQGESTSGKIRMEVQGYLAPDGDSENPF